MKTTALPKDLNLNSLLNSHDQRATTVNVKLASKYRLISVIVSNDVFLI